MQLETYTIFAGLLIGWLATSFYFLKALKRAHIKGVSEGLVERNELHSQRVQVLNRDIVSLNRLRESELEQYANKLKELRHARTTFIASFTHDDHLALSSAADTLRLAQETWQAFPGTEQAQARAATQQKKLTTIATTVRGIIERYEKLNGQLASPTALPVEGAA